MAPTEVSIMPINEIKIKEYECSQCGHKWINRVNYKDGPIPKNCAKCKRETWNRDKGDVISPEENGYMRIIRGFRKLYYDFDKYHLRDKGKIIDWPADLSDQFLAIKPRPDMVELIKVIYSSPLGRNNNSTAISRASGKVPDPKNPKRLIRDYSGWEPDPDRAGYLRPKRHDPKFVSDYQKWIMKEASTRKKIMIDIMKSRGITYKPDLIAIAAYKKAQASQDKKIEEMTRAMFPQYFKKE